MVNHFRLPMPASAAAATVMARLRITASGNFLQILVGQLSLVVAGIAHRFYYCVVWFVDFVSIGCCLVKSTACANSQGHRRE